MRISTHIKLILNFFLDMIHLSKPEIPLESSIKDLLLYVILIMARRNVEKGEVG